MKIIIASIITANLLFSSSLENSLINTDFKQVETKKIKYYIVREERRIKAKIETQKIDENTIVKGSALSNNLTNLETRQNKIDAQLNEEQKNKKYLKQNINEIIVLKHLKIPELYKEHGLREKVIVSFNIDKNKNISKIKYEKESKYPEINRKIKEAIIDSRFDLITNNKEKITLFYDFQI
ncbi:hypothetical protein Arnit_1685 [Arcobacter nitrofigilis DSM 7299]|uniref:TonB C-terminal domain-containing protein n=1 Tax=Arcobacter nitrofigilis (strain ATCC 33309 / DSM 7299 / CCUG 15893 / LMG 7604 / NCTC 12251 / CI) TaxID=572480 RepID=D5UZX0_ARCNC|nr:hypothetical protein [Arcobacter nitrofigilis]ADG93339.1 hypothetical protein Arnit_1685 [Arcobacter nitrofigilis DSM 7299]